MSIKLSIKLIWNIIESHTVSGPSQPENKPIKDNCLAATTEVSSVMQGATSVPLLTVDTVVSVTGNDNSTSSGSKLSAITSIAPPEFHRKGHKSGGDDEGDGAKHVSFQRPPYFRTASRRSLQLVRGPSR